jgi:hypothetical protein
VSDTAKIQPPPPEELRMEIHKPKPVHNWRGFLKEYVIIVLGVATALAAEQAVEWLHWHNEVATARSTLMAEIAANDVLMARRIILRPCMERQISEAEAIIGDLEAKRPPRSYTALHTGIEQLYNDSQWQSERASQVLTHFPDQELALMTSHYATLEPFRLWMDHEGYAWADLSVLRNPPANLTGSDFLRLRASLSIARRMNAITARRAENTLGISRKLGLTPPPPEPVRVEKFCALSDVGYNAWQRDTGQPRQ